MYPVVVLNSMPTVCRTVTLVARPSACRLSTMEDSRIEMHTFCVGTAGAVGVGVKGMRDGDGRWVMDK